MNPCQFASPISGKKTLGAILSLTFVIASAWLILRGSGMFFTPSWAELALVSCAIMLLSLSKWSFYAIVLPIGLIFAIYTPTGLNFGAPSYQYIASIFATDLLETQEFLRQIPFSSYLCAIAIPLLLLAHFHCVQKYQIEWFKNRLFLVFSTLLFAYFSPIAEPLKISANAFADIMEEMQKLKNLAKESRWGKSELVNSRYDDYVIVLGESARRDYLGAYGYPIDNTPFMSHANGTLVDGMTSAGTNTVASLRLMLTLPDKQNWQPNYDLSLLDLAKSAGIKTYWLSNQGRLGDFDTPIASLASKADETLFLKKGGSFNSTNFSDFDLLPKFAQVLDKPSSQKRLIVLHIYGSHPLACDRVSDYPKIFEEKAIDKKYAYLNCYLSSIKKTDEFLQRVYQLLEQNAGKTHRPFSLLYFSDHGLCHQQTETEISFNQNCHSRLHHNIPLFKISSDDVKRREIHGFKSGLNFVEGIANWLGIRNDKLQTIDLFSDNADPEDYGLQKMIEQKYRPDLDNAIDIRPTAK